HGIVGEHEDRGQLHQSREPDRWAFVITKDEEGGAEWSEFRNGQPVYDCAHRMLANPEVEILAAPTVRLKIPSAFILQQGLVRRSEIGRSTEKPRNILRQHVQHLA